MPAALATWFQILLVYSLSKFFSLLKTAGPFSP